MEQTYLRRIKRMNKLKIWESGIIVFTCLIFFSCKKDEPFPSDGYIPTAYNLVIPENFPALISPSNNPMTVEGIKLGRMLFYDPILSGDSTQSCSSCHKQANAFADPRRFSLGIDSIAGNMNAPHIVNPGWGIDFFWNGREIGLEAQAQKPVTNPIEMHETWENAEMKLARSAVYPRLFYEAFGTETPTRLLAAKAIAQFERTFVSANSRFDMYLAHYPQAGFTQSEFNGYQIFFTEVGDCFHCHTLPLMADNLFHNNGLNSTFPGDEAGRFLVTNQNSDLGKFKTPSLRNIEVSAPFMHDGRFATLEEVVDFYSSGIQQSQTIDPLIIKPPHTNGLQLSATQKSDLVAFLKTFTDTAFLNRTDLANPF